MTYETTYEILETQANTNGSSPAATTIGNVNNKDDDVTLSYDQLFKKVNQCARLIHSYTGKRGACSAFLLPSTLATQAIMWGGASIGVTSPLNPLLQAESLESLLERADAEVIFVLGPNPATDFWEKIQSVSANLPKLKAVISVGIKADDATAHFEDVIDGFSDAPLEADLRPSGSDHTAYFHTGGTTGTPKLAIHTHSAHQAVISSWHGNIHGLKGKNTINGLPLFHVGGSILNCLCSYAVGGHMVVPHPSGYRSPEVVSNLWNIIERYQLDRMVAIPTTLGTLAQLPVGDADLSNFKGFITGGAIVPEAVSKALTANCGRGVWEMYGMTEACALLTAPDTRKPHVIRSAGKIIPNCEIRIGASGKPVGEADEVHFKGPNLFSGYIGGIEDPMTDDGYLKTGDIGYLDDDGNLFLTGRAKDLIIRSGHNIDPLVIEACLEKHPAVSMATAVGRPDTYAGEIPIAYVELKQGASVTEDELRAFAMENIDERPACPKTVHIIDALPVTAVGKIFKPALRAIAAGATVLDQLADQGISSAALEKADVLKSGTMQVQITVSDSEKSKATEICTKLSESFKIDVIIAG